MQLKIECIATLDLYLEFSKTASWVVVLLPELLRGQFSCGSFIREKEIRSDT